MVAVQQNASALRALEEKAEQLLLKARLPMGQEEVRDVAELLEKVSRDHFHLPIRASNRRRIDAGPPLSDRSAYEEAMLSRARETVRAISYPPQIARHPPIRG